MKKKKTDNQPEPAKRGLKLSLYTITLIAMFFVFIFGGGIEGKNWSLKTEGVPGLIRAIQDRPKVEDVFEKYKDSTTIKDPDKLLRIIKESIDNKDNKK
jgi:hypothetical protein